MFRKKSRLISVKARELLLSGENYITLVFAIIVFALAAALPFVAYYMAYGSVSGELLIFAFFLLELFTAFPLLFGILRIAGLASQKADVSIPDVFYAFGSIKKYLKVISLGFIQIFKHLLPLSLGYIIANTVIYVFNVSGDLAGWLALVIVLLAYALFLPLITRLYALNLLVMADDVNVIKGVKLSWGYTRKSTALLVGYSLKSIPLLIISIAAVCVPLVLYTMPFLFCAYVISCRRLIQKQNDICPEEISEGVEEINEQDS